jgi:hypothetical protein
LALISAYPNSYKGPTADLGAVSAVCACDQNSSQRLCKRNVTVIQPGGAYCVSNGFVSAGTYTLSKVELPGAVFDRWECFATNSGTAIGPQIGETFSLSGNMTVTCVAVFDVLASGRRLSQTRASDRIPSPVPW